MRNLTSNLCVWYPNRLSKDTSLHHKNIINRSTTKENKTEAKEILRLMYNIKLVIREKRIREDSKGQKEAWTARNGDTKKTLIRKEKKHSIKTETLE